MTDGVVLYFARGTMMAAEWEMLHENQDRRQNENIVGAIVLEELDFLVDCSLQRLVPWDPRIVINEIE